MRALVKKALPPPVRSLYRGSRGLARTVAYLRTGRVRRLPFDLITNEYGFSFGENGWNYLRDLAAQLSEDTHLPLEQTAYFAFFRHERVRAVETLEDVLFLHDPERVSELGRGFYLGSYPWGDLVSGGPWGRRYDQDTGKDTRDLYGYRANPWHQPGDEHALAVDADATRAVVASLRNGYRPWWHARLPEVTMLVRRDGEFRAMRYDGQHRLAVLAEQGREQVRVLVPSLGTMANAVASWPSNSPFVEPVRRGELIVREDEVEAWPYVRAGCCSREHALAIFAAYFEHDGRERREALGIPASY
jgi:hypothetical protein